MGFLTGVEIRRRIADGSLGVQSLDPEEPFGDNQITEDAIDLRLAPAGLVLKSTVEMIDFVHDDFESMYDLVHVPVTGYLLQPNEVFLTQTLEAVSLPDDLLGLVITRSSFARLGLTVTCLAPKSPPGMRWAFPLQLLNSSRVPVLIYPFISMAQMLIAETTGVPVGYRGKYQDSYSVAPPIFSPRERESIGRLNVSANLRTFHIAARDVLTGASHNPEASKVEVPTRHQTVYAPNARKIVLTTEGTNMGDTYNTGQAGAVGPDSTGSFVNLGSTGFDMTSATESQQLAAELSAVRTELRRISSGSISQDLAIAAVAQAEAAATDRDGPKVLDHLREAGRWVLETSKSMGAALATKAIEKAMGLE